MDSVSSFAGARLPRSGGKIVRPRRTAAVRTPYDRPTTRSQDPTPPQQNPSWISRLVFKPARVIASGAGKFISSVVFSESSEDEDSASDFDGDEDVEKDITDFIEDDTMPTIQLVSSERVIEQLLMQETFAREEGDRLIDIIKARVVDHPSVPAAYKGRHNDNGLKSDVNVGEMSNQAVMEAKKWLEEKKSASSSKYKGTEDGAGSPVDVAKTYMRARLPWGSPAVNNLEFRTPSPAGMQLPKEGTPFPYSAGNLSSSKRERRSRSNQSWNIQDEIRKVRAKATEEMLKSVPSSNVASLEPKQNPYNLDASLNVDGGVQAVLNEQSGALPNSIIPTSENKQKTTEGNQAAEETGVLHTRFCGVGLDETFISTQGVKPSEDMNTAPQSGIDVGDFDNHDHNLNQPSSTIGVTSNVVLALGATLDPTDEIGAEHPASNGFRSPSPSSSVAMEGQPKPKPPEVTKVSSNPGDENGSDGVENNDSDSSSSHNSSSSLEEEWLPGDKSLRNSNSASTTKVLAYSRRGRSRGRGRGRGK